MNRIAVVTGAGRGLGWAVTQLLAGRGDRVLMGVRDTERAAARVAGELPPPLRDTVTVLRLDVSDDDSVTDFGRRVADLVPAVDVLVNNAGINYDAEQRPSEADLALVRDTVETNFLGAWRMLIALSPSLRRSASGRVVNVSSGLGSLAGMSDHAPAYSASKAAMNAVTRLFAAELAPDGVLVNSVCPGWLATDMGGPDAGPVGDGARRILWGIDLPDDGPTGGFFRDGEPVAW